MKKEIKFLLLTCIVLLGVIRELNNTEIIAKFYTYIQSSIVFVIVWIISPHITGLVQKVKPYIVNIISIITFFISLAYILLLTPINYSICCCFILFLISLLLMSPSKTDTKNEARVCADNPCIKKINKISPSTATESYRIERTDSLKCSKVSIIDTRTNDNLILMLDDIDLNGSNVSIYNLWNINYVLQNCLFLTNFIIANKQYVKTYTLSCNETTLQCKIIFDLNKYCEDKKPFEYLGSDKNFIIYKNARTEYI